MFMLVCWDRYSHPSTWDVYLGLHEQKDKSKAVKRGLKQVISHPSYNAYTFDFDIALMELDSPVTLSDTVHPICLPSASHVFPAGKSVWITGWGATREGGRCLKRFLFILYFILFIYF